MAYDARPLGRLSSIGVGIVWAVGVDVLIAATSWQFGGLKRTLDVAIQEAMSWLVAAAIGTLIPVAVVAHFTLRPNYSAWLFGLVWLALGIVAAVVAALSIALATPIDRGGLNYLSNGSILFLAGARLCATRAHHGGRTDPAAGASLAVRCAAACQAAFCVVSASAWS